MAQHLTARDHPDKVVRKGLAALLADDPDTWILVKAGDWGSLRCNAGCCTIRVDGTPQNSDTHLRRIQREVRRHPLAQDDPRSRRRE